MRRWIFLLGLAAGCDNLGSVELHWDVTHAGQASSCADVGAADVQVVFTTGDALEQLTPCNEGVDTYAADKGDTTLIASLLAADQTELTRQTVDLHVAAGDPTVVNVTFDVVP